MKKIIIIFALCIVLAVGNVIALSVWNTEEKLVTGSVLNRVQINIDNTGTCEAKRYVYFGYDFPISGIDSGLCSECDGSGSMTSASDDSGCGIIDCDGMNYYFTEGSASAIGTNYCKQKDYADITSNRCEGLNDCKDANTADCTSYSDLTAATCGTCKYATGACSSCTNYGSGTSCSSGMACDGSGNCVATGGTWVYTGAYLIGDSGPPGCPVGTTVGGVCPTLGEKCNIGVVGMGPPTMGFPTGTPIIGIVTCQ